MPKGRRCTAAASSKPLPEITVQQRSVKVDRLYRSTPGGREVLVPHLRLKGLWMKEAGFAVGECVRVEVEHNRLVLTPIAADGA